MTLFPSATMRYTSYHNRITLQFLPPFIIFYGLSLIRGTQTHYKESSQIHWKQKSGLAHQLVKIRFLFIHSLHINQENVIRLVLPNTYDMQYLLPFPLKKMSLCSNLVHHGVANKIK